MTDQAEWSREVWEASVSSRCWWFTPYDAGWDGCKQYGGDIEADGELREIVEMEHQLGDLPEWAWQIIKRCFNYLPPCGHHLFPLPYLEALAAVGAEAPPAFLHTCYTAEPARKERAQDYCFCLDAWLAGADPEDAATELAVRKRPGSDWAAVCRDLWQVLGERTDVRELLVERILHRYRWWIKSLVWDDDSRDLFGRDQYLGNIAGSGDKCGTPFRDPFFVERQVPRVKKLEARIAEVCPDGKWFVDFIHCTWLCAPKSFRFLERILWAVGKGRKPEPGDDIPGFLRCEDTYPNHEVAAEWWRAFLTALDAWWQEKSAEGDVADDVTQRLGERTPVKCWLVRLFARRLRRLAENGDELTRLVLPKHNHRRGTADLATSEEGP
jgi:hypothetical protein